MDRWEHHEHFWLNLSNAFTGLNAFTGIITEKSLFASAAGNADTRAQRVGIFAGSIASFALTIFFVIAAHLGLNGHGFDGRHAASFRMNADAVFIFQKSGFAEATDDAIASADRARMGIGAGGRASGSASEEHFVIFALGNFRWISEKLHGFRGIAFGFWHANALSISQMIFFAKASDDAVLGANRARIRISAGGSASRTAWIEKFIVRAFWFGLRELHGDFVVGLAFFKAYTFTVRIFQVSLFTETTDDALEGTHGGWLGIGAVWYASGSACQKFGIWTAFFFDRKSRGGDSKPEGTSAEQQNVS